MTAYKEITILGDGGWGTTLAILLDKKGFRVTLWSPFAAYARLLDSKRVNPNFLKGVKIPKSIRVSADLKNALAVDLIVLAIPSQYLRSVLSKGKAYYRRSIPVVSVVKGIEKRTFMRMSEVIRQVWKCDALAVLSGPTIAQEVVRGIPTAAVVASSRPGLARRVQNIFMTPTFRIYINTDVTGVELGGSLKNVIAIACGIADGLRFGTNTKAALVARGLTEMARLGSAMGAKKETFMGISGLGDLVTTCFNHFSRNHFVGAEIGRGVSMKTILGRMKMVAEGVPTAKSAWALAKKFRVDMPITNEIYHVLYSGRTAAAAVRNLMLREKKTE
jgi:glycerol-3-phosphate dehydrogenase (NAD(P)+)